MLTRKYEKGSDNVFKDLGLPNAEELKAKTANQITKNKIEAGKGKKKQSRLMKNLIEMENDLKRLGLIASDD